jgi:uncharacterized protein YhfF
VTTPAFRIEDLARRSGYDLAGAFAFGDSPELADELLAFVARGSKRATAGSVAELEASDEPFPEPGLCWGLLDGQGIGRFVMQTTEVRIGRLDSVDAAFAWDEGEYDRTHEDWLEGHRRYFSRQGIAEPDGLEVAFERFRIVWPIEDAPVWLSDGVREIQVADRPWVGRLLRDRHGAAPTVAGEFVDPCSLPGLVAEQDGVPAGVLTFRPRPGGVTDVVTVDVVEGGDDRRAALLTAIERLAVQEGWTRLRD